MKLSRATSLFVLCAITLLVTAPTGIVAQGPVIEPGHRPAAPGSPAPGSEPNAPGDTTTSVTPKPTSATAAVTTTTTVPHTSPPTTTTTIAPVVPTSTPAPVKTSAATSAPPKSTASTASVILPTGPAPTNGTASTCLSSADCANGLLCQLAVSGSPTGVCGPMPVRFFCKPTPPQVCVTTAECRNPAYSICRPSPDNSGNQTICVGLGDPVLSPCTQDAPNSDDGITNTLKYAGIGVGSVAAFAVVFALVRWQRRRQRSKMPENMFGEVDYGMTDRSTTKTEPYAFASRTAAQGSENYEDNYYQGGAGGGGGGGYNKDQYYDDQHYGHDDYSNGGGYGHGGHGGHNEGFYDNAGYDDYNQQPAAPARAMSPRGGDYQMDHYGVEPSEVGYGGHGHGHGGHGGGGYDRY
ncbi:hypothetical protein CPB97_000615 [Podila verticillata]|nr:hypothetical protein CPB97_000615 [Podila verticillata]